MSALSQQPYLTPDQYLQIEETGNIKHEYIDGQSYAMAGASDAHVTIAGNLFALLRGHVRGSDCRVYISDMKARIEALNRFYYPDVMVSCDSRDLATPNYKRFPTLIIEVLSDSTEAFDRGDKFIDYQQIDSLREYEPQIQRQLQPAAHKDQRGQRFHFGWVTFFIHVIVRKNR